MLEAGKAAARRERCAAAPQGGGRGPGPAPRSAGGAPRQELRIGSSRSGRGQGCWQAMRSEVAPGAPWGGAWQSPSAPTWLHFQRPHLEVWFGSSDFRTPCLRFLFPVLGVMSTPASGLLQGWNESIQVDSGA